MTPSNIRSLEGGLSQVSQRDRGEPSGQITDRALLGDKVRIKAEPHSGERGVVEELRDADLVVQLDNGETIAVAAKAVTNYSLAARKAWQTMPRRRVGRPRTGRSAERKTVSFRVDADLWRLFGEAADAGLIQSREHAINAWISVYVARYLRSGGGRAVNDPAEFPSSRQDADRGNTQK